MIFMVNLFEIDPLSTIMMLLVGFIVAVVAIFSKHYFKGDDKYGQFTLVLALLLVSIFVMVSANHIALFLVAWALSNLLLTVLMTHKARWKAAYESGALAAKNFLLGLLCISAGLFLLYHSSGQANIKNLLQYNYEPSILFPALLLFLLGAMTQSGIWPMHRWLTSSLNSPSPVSALMHAGLVNGGGFLLIKFSPLYAQLPEMLILIFVVGMVAVFLGTLWKLMQSDVKRMLACSTMSQMGFMMVQCGLGLFPAALAHLCLHGLFKSYLFLASGSAAQEKRLDLGYPPKFTVFILALICGTLASLAFALTSHKTIMVMDTSIFLVVIALVSGAQFAIPILQYRTFKAIFIAVALTVALGALYGASVHFIENLLEPLGLMHPQSLSSVHVIGLMLLIMAWLAMLFGRNPHSSHALPDWALRLYVKALNASQPDPKTVTAHRNHYQF